MKIKNLVIAPHVDDEVLGCGGILDETFFVYFCGIDEGKLRKDKDPTRTEERLKELKEVAGFLGFQWEANQESKVNHYTEQEFINVFEDLINRLKPEKVFLPHPGYNQDHRTVYHAAMVALRPHDINFFVKKVLVYEAVHDVIWNPKEMTLNYFVPIDIERKTKSYQLHRTQVRGMRSPDMLKQVAQVRGAAINAPYAEAFQILRWCEETATKKESSQITTQLNARITTNKRFGSVDLDEWLLQKLKTNENENVLDVGCGTGNHLLHLAKRAGNGKFFGIDASEDSIGEARKKIDRENLKANFLVRGMDEMDDSFKDSSFDTVISVYALYYAGNPEKVLEVLKRKIKEEGKIAVMAPYKGNNDEWYAFLRQFMKIPEKVEAVSEEFMDKVVLPFAEKNFSDVEKHEFVNRITIPSFEDLKDYWVSNVYHKEEYDRDFEAYARKHMERNGAFVLNKKALLVIMRGKK